jgi:hypothetical protein
MVYVVTTRHQYVPCSMWQRYTHWLTDYHIVPLASYGDCHTPVSAMLHVTEVYHWLPHCTTCFIWWLPDTSVCHAPCDRGTLTTTLYHLLHMVTAMHQCVPCSMWTEVYHWLPHCTTCFIWWLPDTSVCHAPCDRGTTDYHIVPLASYGDCHAPVCAMLHVTEVYHWLPHCTTCSIWWLPCTSVCHAPCGRGTTDYHIVPFASYGDCHTSVSQGLTAMQSLPKQ